MLIFSLVSGDVEGRLNDLYSRVKSIQSKVGKFDVNLIQQFQTNSIKFKRFCFVLENFLPRMRAKIRKFLNTYRIHQWVKVSLRKILI